MKIGSLTHGSFWESGQYRYQNNLRRVRGESGGRCARARGNIKLAVTCHLVKIHITNVR